MKCDFAETVPPGHTHNTPALAGAEVRVDQLAEWKQIYREVWRIERVVSAVPTLHGLDAAAMEKKYEPYVESLASRDDLNYILQEMFGDLTASHLRGGT